MDEQSWYAIFFNYFFFLIFLFSSPLRRNLFFLSVNLLYENQKTHDTINSRELLVGYFLFLFCFKESFCKDWWALFNTLKRVRLGLRALGRAFLGYPTGFVFGLPAGFDFLGLWAGLHWFFLFNDKNEEFTVIFWMWGLTLFFFGIGWED